MNWKMNWNEENWVRTEKGPSSSIVWRWHLSPNQTARKWMRHLSCHHSLGYECFKPGGNVWPSKEDATIHHTHCNLIISNDISKSSRDWAMCWQLSREMQAQSAGASVLGNPLFPFPSLWAMVLISCYFCVRWKSSRSGSTRFDDCSCDQSFVTFAFKGLVFQNFFCTFLKYLRKTEGHCSRITPLVLANVCFDHSIAALCFLARNLRHWPSHACECAPSFLPLPYYVAVWNDDWIWQILTKYPLDSSWCINTFSSAPTIYWNAGALVEMKIGNIQARCDMHNVLQPWRCTSTDSQKGSTRSFQSVKRSKRDINRRLWPRRTVTGHLPDAPSCTGLHERLGSMPQVRYACKNIAVWLSFMCNIEASVICKQS